METIENVLAERYATSGLRNIHSARGKNLAEREFWIAVMKAQRELGVNIPPEDIEAYEKAKDNIDLELIEKLEKEMRHDVNAKIKAFNIAAGMDRKGKQHAHKRLTSRDLTDNVEQMQNKDSSKIIFGKYTSVLSHFLDKSDKYKDVVLTARTHHQPAQPTLLGKRFSTLAEELIFHLSDFERFVDEYPLRGIKGPVGTQMDMLSLLGSEEKVDALEKKIAEHLGFKNILYSTGQVYPRSLDYKMCSHLAFLSAACGNFAIGMRLMSGYELATEGFKEGQVGSSAMPHKMNTRTSERIWSLSQLTKMYAEGASRISGEQWEEGDVSCSALRRVLPDAFFASDGICEATLTVLNEMGVYPIIISKEADRYLPFLATTELLGAAIEKGVGREDAHKLIKKYATKVALEMRETGLEHNNLPELLGKDELFPLSELEIKEILLDRAKFIGNAHNHIRKVAEKGMGIISRYPEEAKYEPGQIL